MAKAQETTIDILKVKHGSLKVRIVGTTPIILNRMSMKVLHELLMPKGRKNATERASSLKHDPRAEFMSSPYTDPNPKGATYITHLCSCFKGALRGAALDLAGANKSQIGRLTWIKGERFACYGVPQLVMSVTRSADINKTPDVRTRAIIPQWACEIEVCFVMPNLREQTVLNLLASAGITQGIGDWRTGKGSGTYGSFRIADKDDEEYAHIVKNGGRKQQLAAMRNPQCYDSDTTELLEWFDEEVKKRGFKTADLDPDDIVEDIAGVRAAQRAVRTPRSNGVTAQ